MDGWTEEKSVEETIEGKYLLPLSQRETRGKNTCQLLLTKGRGGGGRGGGGGGSEGLFCEGKQEVDM